MIRRGISVFGMFVFVVMTVAGQDRPPVTPGVGSAVLLATNSIQLDRDVAVVSGDIVVNTASTGPVLGEAQLSLDRGVTTPAGFLLAADDIDIDKPATVGGNVFYNQLHNEGTIAGTLNSPLALPVFANLPPVVDRSAGKLDVIVPDRGFREIEEGSYGNLSVGRGATVRFTGVGYTFANISASREASLEFYFPAYVVIENRLTLGTAAMIGGAPGSGLGPGSIAFQVHGINGTDGALFSVPPAVQIGNDSTIDANLYVTGGSLIFGQNVDATGSFIAVDIQAGRDCRFTVGSTWNLPPTAQPQAVFTNGAAPVAITLRGSDPEGTLLSFSIVSAPVNGTLGAITPISSDSAGVTYTPATSGDLEDSFTFRVSDGTSSSDAVVSINPPGRDPEAPAPNTVVANNAAYDAPGGETMTVLLTGNAPSGVSLNFTLVAGSGPFHGSLGPLVQGSESPRRTATALYTPDAGYIGDDSLQFEACGVISAVNVCSTATIAIHVLPVQLDPIQLVTDVNVATNANHDVLISLFGNSTSAQRFKVRSNAAMLSPAAVAGNVADANGDGVGDNQNDLPGPVPVFMSAGVGQIGGGGSNGTSRMQFEWDITNLASSAGDLMTAHVILPTHRGTIDSLDTYFFAGASSGDGLLTTSDYADGGEKIGAVMSVPSLSELPVGADGTFSFDVIGELQAALKAGFTHLTIQGRVNESLSSGRGLEVRTTATSNVDAFNVPMLELTTPGVTAPLTFKITSLPAFGTLTDTSNNPILSTPYVLSGSSVRYSPFNGFVGNDSFNFEATDGFSIDSARVNVRVILGDCSINPEFCDDGR